MPMSPMPEAIKYQAASDILLVPCAYVMAEPTNTGKTFQVSNVDGFAANQAVTMVFPDGGTVTGTLAATSAVTKYPAVKTLVFTTAPTLPTSPVETVFTGATIVGPNLMSLGGTNGGVRFSAKPDMVDVEYDQVEGIVDSVPVNWAVSASFTLQEFKLDQWGYLSQQGYSLRAASVTAAGSAIVNSANIIDNAGQRVQKFGAKFVFDKQDPAVTTLKDYLLLYKIASIEGVDTSFMKRDPSSQAVTFRALADPNRPRAKRFYQFIEELAAGT